MQCAFVLPAAPRSLNEESQLAAINERLSLALQSSSQIAFDWHISDDSLFFSGTLNENLKGLLLDTSKTWHSSAIPAIIHHDDRENFRRRLHEALKGKQSSPNSHYQVEVRLKDAVLVWRWVLVRGQIIERDGDGRALRIVGTFSDIDERKRAERQTERLRRVYAMLSQANQAIVRIHDRELLFGEICRIAVEYGRFSTAWIGVIDHESMQVIPVAAHGEEREQLQKIAMADAVRVTDKECQLYAAVIENSIGACSSSFNPACRHRCESLPAHSEVRSFARLAFRLDGKPFGILNLYASESDFFDNQVTQALEPFASDITFAIDNIEHESRRRSREIALRESENVKSAILTLALDCIISIDQDSRILSCNKAAELMFGFQSRDVLGKQLADTIIPAGWREQHREIERSLSTGASTVLNRRTELTAMRSDGSSLAVEMAVVPIKLKDQTIFTVFIRDISGLKRNQTILKEQAKNYRQLVELSPQATLVCQESKIVLLNLAASRLLGAHSPADLLGENIMDFVDNADHVSLHELGELSGQGSHSPAFVEQVWHRKDGDRFHAEVGATNLMYNEMPSLQLIVRDITARKRKEKIQLGQTDILNSVATGAPLASILSDIAQFAEEHSNDGLCAIHQLGSDDATLTQCIAPGTQERFIPVLGDEKIGPTSGSCGTAAFRGTPVVVQDIKCDPLWDAKRDVALSLGLNACVSWPVLGKSRKVLGTISLFYREATRPSDADMELLRICANLAGIAIDSRASEERIRYLAHYDGLTSLPNRFMFKEYLDLALRNAQRHRKKFAVLFLDLDKFKQINDTLGHDAGDMVLREMARRLRGCLRHNDKIARMGGDEFYVLIEDLNDGHDAAEVAQKLLDEAIRPIYVGDNECQLSVSIGISIYPDDGSDGEKLLCNADKAMYRTKENGKNGFHFFSMQKAYSRPELPLISPSLLRDNSRVHLV